MKTVLAIWAVLMALALFPNSASAQQFMGPDGRVWYDVREFTKDLYREFLAIPKGKPTTLDVILNPKQSYRLVTVDNRDGIAVYYYRGVPGGQGYVLPEEWLYEDSKYVLEIRWIDAGGQWHYWWNRKKLPDALMAIPGLYPQAINSPF